MTYKEIYAGAIKAWGLRGQFIMVMEECGELITAVSHCMRHRDGAIDELIEEVADAENMVNQMKYFFSQHADWYTKYKKIKQQKMKRVEKLLMEEK